MIPIYVALAALALLGLAIASQRSDVRTWIALAVIVVGATVSVLWAAPDTDGLPRSGAPATGDLLHSCVVDEPTYVYLWAGDPPVSYRLAYTRELHAACDTAKRAARAGIRVGIDARHTAHPHLYKLPPPGGLKEDRG